jgi:hypothetical protein
MIADCGMRQPFNHLSQFAHPAHAFVSVNPQSELRITQS